MLESIAASVLALVIRNEDVKEAVVVKVGDHGVMRALGRKLGAPHRAVAFGRAPVDLRMDALVEPPLTIHQIADDDVEPAVAVQIRNLLAHAPDTGKQRPPPDARARGRSPVNVQAIV